MRRIAFPAESALSAMAVLHMPELAEEIKSDIGGSQNDSRTLNRVQGLSRSSDYFVPVNHGSAPEDRFHRIGPSRSRYNTNRRASWRRGAWR
jgi:hypothetical protein